MSTDKAMPDNFIECHSWKPGMAFRYIGNDEGMKHEVHYFVAHTPIGPHSQVWVAEIPGRQRLHWNGFPNQYERWPEHDKIRPHQEADQVKALPFSDDVMFKFMYELHANVPEIDRPMSWSDFSDEQAERVKAAFRTLQSPPPDEREIENAINCLEGAMTVIREGRVPNIDLLLVAHDELKAARAHTAKIRRGMMESKAIKDVIAERRRQIEKEGWTLEHDDGHDDGSLAKAGACYALNGAGVCDSHAVMEDHGTGIRGRSIERVPRHWPWASSWWKPRKKDPRKDLVRAAALIIAEIERLDREKSHDR